MECRHCKTEVEHVFVDLINAPLSNELIRPDQLVRPLTFYPLKIYVCHNCFLVQTAEIKNAHDIFNSDYPYFSSYSKTWLLHAKRYVDMMMEKYQYNSDSLVIELASNDGYLLQHFLPYNVPVLGIEPAGNTAFVAIQKGIPTIIDFFTTELARREIVEKKRKADLVIGNNVLAHVPDINDFVQGVKLSLKPGGTATFEFPHLIRLIEDSEFDTIYHEHFSYLSFTVVCNIFKAAELEVFDVEELPTHGGSLRIYAKHVEDPRPISLNVHKMLETEERLGVKTLNYYVNFQDKVNQIKYDFLDFLIGKKKEGKKVIGYGAAAKGNTFLNYCGIKGGDLISFVVDASPHKQNKYLPGSQIPIFGKEKIMEFKPDYIIILAWNLTEEIKEEYEHIREWGGKFVTFIPKLRII